MKWTRPIPITTPRITSKMSARTRPLSRIISPSRSRTTMPQDRK